MGNKQTMYNYNVRLNFFDDGLDYVIKNHYEDIFSTDRGLLLDKGRDVDSYKQTRDGICTIKGVKQVVGELKKLRPNDIMELVGSHIRDEHGGIPGNVKYVKIALEATSVNFDYFGEDDVELSDEDMGDFFKSEETPDGLPSLPLYGKILDISSVNEPVVIGEGEWNTEELMYSGFGHYGFSGEDKGREFIPSEDDYNDSLFSSDDDREEEFFGKEEDEDEFFN